jgi:predicted RNA binding protein YcfA (HicA-like mRNA interferase family)
MGGEYPPLDRGQIESILKKLGFTKKRTESSHAQWEGHSKGQRRMVTVDEFGGRKRIKYSKDLTKKMIQQSGLSKKKFYSYLR